MKFYQYINENTGLEKIELSLNETINELIKNCKNNLNWALPYEIKNYINKINILDCGKFYRGYDSLNKNLYFLDSTNSKRKSLNGKNYYTILFSEILESWKDYPRRDKSIIGLINNSLKYREKFLVIPYNDSKIGVCNKQDIWDTCSKATKNLQNYFNFELESALINLSDLNEVLHYDFDINEQNIKKILFENIDDKLKDGYKGQTLYDILNKEYNPKANGFKIVDSFKSISKEKKLESWFVGKAIFINLKLDIFNEENEFVIKLNENL